MVAVDRALGLDADSRILIEAATAGELAACGTAHADNVAPSLLGGLLLIRPGSPPSIRPPWLSRSARHSAPTGPNVHCS